MAGKWTNIESRNHLKLKSLHIPSLEKVIGYYKIAKDLLKMLF
jgi:hypothetical protein